MRKTGTAATKKRKSKQSITVNGLTIPAAFVGRVNRLLKGDRDRVIDAFFRARHMTAPAFVMAYVMAGFKKPKDGTNGGLPYNLLPVKEREMRGGNDMLEGWWTTCTGRQRKEFDIDSLFVLKDVNTMLYPNKRSVDHGQNGVSNRQ